MARNRAASADGAKGAAKMLEEKDMRAVFKDCV